MIDPAMFEDQNPFRLVGFLWPQYLMYPKQVEVMESVWDNNETYVPAGNKLGKDWDAGLIVVCFFLLHSPVRVVTTSVKDDHLRVLWGEMARHINQSRVPLTWRKGGNLIVNHREVRKVLPSGDICPISYILGQVADPPEGMSGHHADSTLWVVDEASGVNEEAYIHAQGWAGGGGVGKCRKRMLIFGNPWPTNNFFRRGVDAGDLILK